MYEFELYEQPALIHGYYLVTYIKHNDRTIGFVDETGRITELGDTLNIDPKTR